MYYKVLHFTGSVNLSYTDLAATPSPSSKVVPSWTQSSTTPTTDQSQRSPSSPHPTPSSEPGMTNGTFGKYTYKYYTCAPV